MQYGKVIPNGEWLYVKRYELNEKRKSGIILTRGATHSRYVEYYEVLRVGSMIADLYKVGDIVIAGYSLGHNVEDNEHKLLNGSGINGDIIGKLEVKDNEKG
jgi:co-chaperonin GroES (HSP10)